MFEEYKRKKLERRRNKTLSAIRGERLAFEAMVQRAQIAGDALDNTTVTTVLERLAEIEQRAERETDLDELDDLTGDAEQQGQLRAYICPSAEIRNEGTLAIDLMEEWNVPKTKVDKLRRLVEPQLKKADTDPQPGRSALRDIFDESDSWSGYTDEYERSMRRYSFWLSGAILALLLSAIITLRFPAIFPLGLSISLAGAVGSCVSVMAKMPVLEVDLSGELESYGRRILSRIGVGVIASIVGCGLLGWGLISLSIQGHTFADVLNACSASPPMSCTGLNTLILLAVPMLFGFSERTLRWFEKKVFGNSG
jgi:hypothetical protein